MLAIISDIHSNKEALEAVLRDISTQSVDAVWCLGDIVGYGPDPKDCIDLVQKNCSLCLMGNHDWAVLNAPVGFNSIATRMIYRTKDWLQITDESTDEDHQRWDFLSSLELRSTQNKFVLVHASPRAELTEYILPSDVEYDIHKLQEIFSTMEGYCFVGHTHMPCCLTEDIALVVPEGTGSKVELDDRKAIINIGSVGQPRDGDNRACYITLEDDLVRYHRVAYHFDKTAEKMSAIGADYETLGRRLTVGR